MDTIASKIINSCIAFTVPAPGPNMTAAYLVVGLNCKDFFNGIDPVAHDSCILSGFEVISGPQDVDTGVSALAQWVPDSGASSTVWSNDWNPEPQAG